MNNDKKSIVIMLDSADELFETTKVAQLIGTNRNFVIRLIKTGLLNSVRIGRIQKVRKFELNRFLKEAEGKDIAKIVQEREAETA